MRTTLIRPSVGTMRLKIFQIILVLIFVSLLAVGYAITSHILALPFRSTNDKLHRMESIVTLDLLIPGGVYLDEKMTIGEVIKIRVYKTSPHYHKMARMLSDLIPYPYRYLANFLWFFFWFALFMTFLRVFTFLGYARAVRASLLLGGFAYYFIPDFSPGRLDDISFIGLALIVISIRFFMVRRKKCRTRNGTDLPDNHKSENHGAGTPSLNGEITAR